MKKIFILLIVALPFQLLFAQDPVTKVTQIIDLKAGWNIVSFHVMPDSTSLKAIFQPLISNKLLIKVQDENGNALEDLGFLGGWINYIGHLSPSEGYRVKVYQDCQLLLEGIPVALPFDLSLKKGWNVMGYPRPAEVDGSAVIRKLIDNALLVKIQDENGNTIEDLGSLGGWTNSIGKMKPGEGYKIKIKAETVLSILEKYSFYTVSIYGRDNCGFTTALRNACTSAGIKYQYYNYDSSYLVREEFWKIVNEFHLGDYTGVGLPVVLVETENGRYGLEQPGISDIKALIGY